VGARVGDGGDRTTSAVGSLQSGLAHQAGHASTAAPLALALQDRVDARGAVGPVRAGVDGGDLPGQFQVAARRGPIVALRRA
jgi:hypothetical protein